MVYYAAGTHFGHASIIRFCDRPFEDVAEMDAELIARWNAKAVDADDVAESGVEELRHANMYTEVLTYRHGEVRRHIRDSG